MKNTPTKLIVNLDEVYYDNELMYSCFDYLLLSGRKKLTSEWSYNANAYNNYIFKIARDAIDHSRREMTKKENTKTPEELIDEIYGGLTDVQKEMVHYLVGKIFNERDKGE